MFNTQDNRIINEAQNLCDEGETKGLDLQAAKTWIYPTNYPVRDYQYNIIQEALLKNTLVSLPTGLGKTFIAAVVMYNFYRWYPTGKIIFMAPTKPLVKQQIEACYNIMAIPKEVTAELTGSKTSTARNDLWAEKRVFFITPQVLQNDLNTLVSLGPKIKCMVFDEAHKARGNYAYCEVIKKLAAKEIKSFRVLALSATPGSNVNDVSEVIQNLLVSHLEFRTEESPDVKSFVFQRTLETVVVPLGEKLEQVKSDYMQILENYTRTLVKYKIIYGNCSTLTKGKIFMVMKDFQEKTKLNKGPNYGEIMKTLNICMTLFHAFELLVRHGLRGFLSFYEGHISKPLLRGNIQLIKILDDLRQYLGPPPNIEPLPDGSYTNVPESTKFGHPKYYKLMDILTEHFSANKDNSSRVIVFFEYRESVTEAFTLLLRARPLVKPRIFLGQGYGVTQRVQLNVIKAFREGECNTLLSTCIGEEGLDVGEVDLIVCFDISNKSPIRMVQRMGRTGRKREGRVVILVTEGKEQQTLKECLIQKNNVSNFVLNSSELGKRMYKESPRMLPANLQPKCEKIRITVTKPVITKNSNLKDMFRSISSNSDKPVFSQDLEIKETTDKLPKSYSLWNKENPLTFEEETNKINFSKNLEKQRSLQPFSRIAHSRTTNTLVNLLKFGDSKRFNIPILNNPKAVQNKATLIENKNLKQGDIRTMFSKATAKDDVHIESTQEFLTNTNSQLSQLETLKKEATLLDSYTELHNEIEAYLSVQTSSEEVCTICTNHFKCPPKVLPDKYTTTPNFFIPDLSILNNITIDDLDAFAGSLSPKSQEIFDDFNTDDVFNDFIDDSLLNNIKVTQIVKEQKLESSRFIEENVADEQSFMFRAPKSLLSILGKFDITREETSQMPSTSKTVPKEICLQNEQNVESELEKIISQKEITVVNLSDSVSPDMFEATPEEYKDVDDQTLAFFKLDCLENIFKHQDNKNNIDDDFDMTQIYSPEITKNQHFISNNSPNISQNQDIDFNVSPEITKAPHFEENTSPILENSTVNEKAESPIIGSQVSNSPVLTSRDRLQHLKNRLFHKDRSNSDVSFQTSTQHSPSVSKDRNFKPNLSKLRSPISFLSNDKRKENNSAVTLDLGDICDLSNFGLTDFEKKDNEVSSKDEVATTLDISDLCDLSAFGISDVVNKVESPKFNNTTPRKENVDQQENSDLDETIDGLDLEKSLWVNKNKRIVEQSTPRNKNTITRNLSEIFNSDNEPSPKKTSPSQKPPKSSKYVLENSQDLLNDSFAFEDEPTLDKTPQKAISPPQNNKSNEIIEMVDLTDSDFETSPIKPTFASTQRNLNKTMSQISITQAIGLINEKSQRSSQFPKASQQNKRISTPKISQPSTSKKENNTNSLNLLDDLNNFEEFSFSFKKKFEAPLPAKKKCQNVSKLTSQKTQSKYDLSIASATESDDEFERPVSPIWAKPKIKPPKAEVIQRNLTKTKLQKKKRLVNEFLDLEAALSQEEISEDEDSGEDCYDASFVNDETQNVDETQMHAKYLQSVRSPPIQRGRFKIPERPRYNITNVYSQFETMEENNTYLNDSFCVNNEEESQIHDLSELEILELKLKQQKKLKKRKKSEEQIGSNPKRRRILQVLSDDSD